MKSKNIILSLGIFILLVGYIFAAHTITNSTSIINEDTNSLVTVNVDNTDATADTNISTVNITLPSGFVFITDSNSTNAGTHIFSNTSNVLSWSNDGLVMNLTNNDFNFNVTVTTAGDYNLTVTTLNVTGTYSSNVSININDTTYPTVSFVSPVIGGNVSASYVINVSVTDDTLSYIYFNITNSSGVQNSTLIPLQISGTDYWNATWETSILDEGTYNITVWVNDSNNQVNDTVVAYSVLVDNTNPSVSFSCSDDSVYKGNELACSCSGTDSGSGVASTSYENTPSTSTIGTFTETCTITDRAGNIASSTITYTVKSSGDGSSSTTSNQWSITYKVLDEQFKQGYSKQLSVSQRLKVMIGSVEHHVGVKTISADSVIIEIASEPIEVTLNTGEDIKADVDEDGIYDIYVILNTISGNKADITVKQIEEVVPEGEESIETTGEITQTEAEESMKEEDEEGNSSWLVWIIVLVILLVIVGILYMNRDKLMK
ncbi:MAG: Ig-like domain-containing protein [Candidatus Pacearchaeota archaeon]|nr:Ig-like domain-containing protein [Candidatus Pacearchaeota archaeon]